MKKIISILMSAIMITMTVGCTASNQAKSTVVSFIKASKKFDIEKMRSKIYIVNNESSKQVDYLKESSTDKSRKYFLDLLKDNASKIEYKVEEVTTTGDTAIVKVKFKYIDSAAAFKAAIGVAFTKLLGNAFTGTEMSEEETGKIILDEMKKQQESTKSSFTEKTIDIKCIKVKKEWYIDNLNNDLIDVIMSNLYSVGEQMSNDLVQEETNNTGDITSETDQPQQETIIIEKSIGDEVILATIKLKINKVEEKETISGIFESSISAKNGAKFIVINIDITNSTTMPFMFPSGFIVVDNQNRQFNTYNNTIGNIDNYIESRDLAPSIAENGNLVFEIPDDAISYSMLLGKSGTNEVYRINLK